MLLSALALLFSPSLTLLGMAGPFAIKLPTSRPDGAGTNSGSIYAVSTLGSVAGLWYWVSFCFLVGSREILVGLGIALFQLSVAAAAGATDYFGFKSARGF